MEEFMFSIYRQARKVTFDYLVFLIVYVAFLPLIISLAKDNIDVWAVLYSFIVGMLMFLVIWTDIYEMAKKEKKPMYKLDPSPHKGLLIGFIGMLPAYILSAAAFIFTGMMGEEIPLTPELINIINDAFLSPMFFIISLLDRSPAAYVTAYAAVPLICYLAYLMGNKGITKKGIINSIKRPLKNNSKSEDKY
jgi:hypothetical protein